MHWYEDLVKQHGGKHRDFSQGRGLALVTDDPLAKGGICTGWCLVFLSLENSDERLHAKRNNEQDPTLVFHAATAQKFTRQGDLKTIAAQFGLTQVGSPLEPTSPEGVAFTSRGSPGRLSLILLGNHAVAFSQVSGSLLFFDPEWGFAQFGDTLKFTLFMRDYFEHFSEHGGYSRKNGNGATVVWLKAKVAVPQAAAAPKPSPSKSPAWSAGTAGGRAPRSGGLGGHRF